MRTCATIQRTKSGKRKKRKKRIGRIVPKKKKGRKKNKCASVQTLKDAEVNGASIPSFLLFMQNILRFIQKIDLSGI